MVKKSDTKAKKSQVKNLSSVPIVKKSESVVNSKKKSISVNDKGTTTSGKASQLKQQGKQQS